MPEMDCYATANWIKINYPEIKILALSTMDADTAIIKMIKNGPKGFVLTHAFDEVLSRDIITTILSQEKSSNL